MEMILEPQLKNSLINFQEIKNTKEYKLLLSFEVLVLINLIKTFVQNLYLEKFFLTNNQIQQKKQQFQSIKNLIDNPLDSMAYCIQNFKELKTHYEQEIKTLDELGLVLNK